MIELPQITVLIADTKNHAQAIYAIKKTLEQIKPAKVVFMTDRDFEIPEVTIVKIPTIKGKEDYSRVMVKESWKYFDTDFCLTIQHDGYCICGEAWKDEFLNYDFTASPWLYPDEDRNVGNGAFSLRSKKLATILGTDDFIEIVSPEDEIIGRLYRRYLEGKYDIKFAPESLAHTFAYELHEPYSKTFGFHSNFHPPFREIVVIRREGAFGDIIRLEPLLHYFWMKGYRVVLDTLPQFYELFRHHYFPVEAFGTLNQLLPYKLYDLNMAYEITPKQLHLKSYYDFCGITDGVIRNPRINFISDEQNKLFRQKFVVLHLDNRLQASRNIYGIDWDKVIGHLNEMGYLVFQVSKNECIETKAIQIRTLTENLLAYLISGCELFIGTDSGPSHVAVATGRKVIAFFGSVNPAYIHADLTNIKAIYQTVCDKPFCWHEVIGTTGTKCYIDDTAPPCTKFDTQQLLNAINEML